MKKLLIYIQVLICCVGLAQSKSDSTRALTISVGNKFAYDLIFFKSFHNAEHYKYRPSFTNSIIFEFKYAFGEKKRVGLGIEPYFGYKYVSFNAIIPSTDFDNPPDEFTNLNNEFQFYKNGQLLPTEHYTYKKSYLKYGINLNLYLKLKPKLHLLINVGMNKVDFNSKNYPDYIFPRCIFGNTGSGICNHPSYVDLFYQADNEIIRNIGLGLQYKLKKKILFILTIEKNSDEWIDLGLSPKEYLPFLSGYGIEDYYKPSIAFTLKYNLY